MIRRCPAPLTALVAALVFGLGSQPISDAGRPGRDGRLFLDVPQRSSRSEWSHSQFRLDEYRGAAGRIACRPCRRCRRSSIPSSTQGPLTILAGSQGFDQTGVYDYLASSRTQWAASAGAWVELLWQPGSRRRRRTQFFAERHQHELPSDPRMGQQRIADDVPLYAEPRPRKPSTPLRACRRPNLPPATSPTPPNRCHSCSGRFWREPELDPRRTLRRRHQAAACD